MGSSVTRTDYVFSKGNLPVHSYLVELTIAGDSIDELALSQQIGLEATRFFKKGEERSPGRIMERSLWSLEVLPDNGKEWLSLEEGLMCLVGKLTPARNHLKELAAEYDVFISCGHFYSSFGGGPTLSPKMLELLAQFGVSLRISDYWGEEGPEEGGER
ncbi:MAG: DUF4279 domain-containing protein [Acidobacteriales bacterium]|nr:DUF4279 domain-containing protein [Terriglobales bacterium]